MRLMLIFVLSVLILSSSAFAAEVYQYSANVEINDNVYYELKALLVNYTSNSFTIIIPGVPYDLTINSSVYCAQKDTVWGKEIRCDMSSIANRVDIIIDYKTDNKLTKKGSYYVFSDSFQMPADVTKFSLIVKLPEGSGLIQGNESYSPQDALLGSDGRRSFVYWTQEDMKEGDSFDVSIAYESVGILGYSVLETLSIVLITLVVIAVVFFKYYSKQKPVNIILPVLKADEKLIFEAITKHEPGINQKIIVKESGYSKAKVSKVLKNLQERGLLRLERIGRSNKVYYDAKFKSKEQKTDGNNKKP